MLRPLLKTNLSIFIFLFLSSWSQAQSDSLRREIHSLAVQIQDVVFDSEASTSELREVRNSLEEALNILDGNGHGFPGELCETFNPLRGESSSVFTVVRNPGYSNNGTLKWPNGNVFLLRNSGYNNDYTLKYPNGNTMRLKNTGYTNNNQTYWPNGQKLLLMNSGYSNHGTIYRNDGSVWLLRNRGYNNDGQRYGLPVDRYENGREETMEARLTNDDSVTSVYRYVDSTYSVEIRMNPTAADPVIVTTCY